MDSLAQAGFKVEALSRPLGTDKDSDGFLESYASTLTRFEPDVVVVDGTDSLASKLASLTRQRRLPVVLLVRQPDEEVPGPLPEADALLVFTRFAAAHTRNTLGLQCEVLPYPVDIDRVRATSHDRRYLTFIDPSPERGVHVFARIADELGRRRPDIPLLVVEGHGTERTLADCGLDLRVHGNVSLMAHTEDPRHYWSVTRLCVMPSLGCDYHAAAAIEAMVNGIPVIGSDRGAIRECLGNAGLIVSVPERLGPRTHELPTVSEVVPWLDAVIRLWDDGAWYAEQCRRSSSEARRWDPATARSRYVEFFNHVRPISKSAIEPARNRSSPLALSPVPAAFQQEAASGSRPSIESGIRAIRRRWPGITNDCDEHPVFVLSAGWRSGSTMLQRMIMRECFLWGEPFGHSGLVDSLADPIRCFNDRWPEAHHFHRGEETEALSQRFIANLYPPVDDLIRAQQSYFLRLLAEPARRHGARQWGMKEVRLDCDHAIYLQWLFPRARFLLLIRNPYDAYRSYAARAARGWTWYHRWPGEPVTVGFFARHWRRLVTSFIENHHRIDALVVRYEDLRQGRHSELEDYVGFPLSKDAARANPSDGGPPPLPELLAADHMVLENELGPLASSLGYASDDGPARGRQASDGLTGREVGDPSGERSSAPAGRLGSAILASAGSSPKVSGPDACVILVPVGHHIEPSCDAALRELERRGYTVRRVHGYSAIDQARNQMATDALRDGFQEILWIDADIVFAPEAVDRLRSHGESVICGIYAKKGENQRSFACKFPRGTSSVSFRQGWRIGRACLRGHRIPAHAPRGLPDDPGTSEPAGLQRAIRAVHDPVLPADGDPG
ncbi:MAG: sulfotransferase [Isosphaeraceae bacterium]